MKTRRNSAFSWEASNPIVSITSQPLPPRWALGYSHQVPAEEAWWQSVLSRACKLQQQNRKLPPKGCSSSHHALLIQVGYSHFTQFAQPSPRRVWSQPSTSPSDRGGLHCTGRAGNRVWIQKLCISSAQGPMPSIAALLSLRLYKYKTDR